MTKVVQSPGARAVQTVTLRSFCDRRSIRPTVIKVDVEGGEHRVFNASSEPLVRAARVLVVEVHEEALAADGVTSHALCEQLRGWGKEPITLGATAHARRKWAGSPAEPAHHVDCSMRPLSFRPPVLRADAHVHS